MNRITIDDLPGLDNSQAIFDFAMAFNGYAHFGSFSASMHAAKQKTRATLVDVRNELFASARSSRHMENEDLLGRYRELFPILHELLESAAKEG